MIARFGPPVAAVRVIAARCQLEFGHETGLKVERPVSCTGRNGLFAKLRSMVNQSGTDLPPTRPTGDTEDPQFPTGGGGPETEDSPVGLRVGRNPANVGDEVPDVADATFPEVVPQPAEM